MSLVGKKESEGMPSAADTIFTIELTGKEIAIITAMLDSVMAVTPVNPAFCEEILVITNKIVEQVNKQTPT